MSRSILLSVFIGSLALCACSKPEAPPMQPDAAEPLPIPSATIPEATSSEPPAESSLAIKRGMLTLETARTTFQPCGEPASLWVVDESDGIFRESFLNDPQPVQLYVEAHGERTQVPEQVAEAKSFPGAFIIEEVLYATPPSEAQGCKEPAPSYVVMARGNEPFWSVEVASEKLTWRQPEAPQEVVFDAVQSDDAEGTVGYTGKSAEHTLELFIDAQPCRDSMSGAFFAYTARATFDGKALKGCARIGA